MWKSDPCACLLVSRSLYRHACFSQSTKKIVLLNDSNDGGIQSGLHLRWMIVNFTNRIDSWCNHKSPPPLHSEWLTSGLLLGAVAYVQTCEAGQPGHVQDRWWLLLWGQLGWMSERVFSPDGSEASSAERVPSFRPFFFYHAITHAGERIWALIVKDASGGSLINLPPPEIPAQHLHILHVINPAWMGGAWTPGSGLAWKPVTFDSWNLLSLSFPIWIRK